MFELLFGITVSVTGTFLLSFFNAFIFDFSECVFAVLVEINESALDL